MTKEELNRVLELHKKWVDGEDDGARADLIGVKLCRTDLKEVDLREADLRGANLYRANLSRADLSNADLYEANLYEADLYKANLREANLREADLREADLREANLREADLINANLYKADLRGTDLSKADLYGADLRGANLVGTIGIRTFTAGEHNRLCFTYIYNDEQRWQLGCFNGNYEETLKAVENKYGTDSHCYKMIVATKGSIDDNDGISCNKLEAKDKE